LPSPRQLYVAPIASGSISPVYGGPADTPPAYSRWLFRVKTLSITYNGAALYVTFGANQFALARSGLVGASGNPGKNEIAQGYLVETVFVPSFEIARAH